MNAKRFFIAVAIFALISASFGQITCDASDSIVLERMSKETRPHTVYLKMDTAAIATKAGELLELDYPCWIYYIHYCDQAEDSLAARRYLVVKESSGNVLEVRTRNDVSPPNYATWRIIRKYLMEIPFTEYVLDDSCQLRWENLNNDTIIVINSKEELENYIMCATDSTYPAIDFSQNSLLLLKEITYPDSIRSNPYHTIHAITKNLVLFSTNEYKLNITILVEKYSSFPYFKNWEDWVDWHPVAMIVPKLICNATLELNVSYPIDEDTLCENTDTTLRCTQWKLVGIFDGYTDTLIKILEPNFPEAERLYTLAFKTDSSVFGHIVNDWFYWGYEADYNTHSFSFREIRGSYISQMPPSQPPIYLDVQRYCNIIFNPGRIFSFSSQEDELRLYYWEGFNYQNYLLYYKLQ